MIAWDLLHGGLQGDRRRSRSSSRPAAPGRIYRVTTNAYACTGDGAAMALRLGLPLKDMEFMQFHPTTLYPTGILMTEGCRGEGAYLINKDGERFMKRYAPNALELASRDVVSRSEQTEIDEGRGINGSVMLDMRHLGAEKIIERLPGSRELAITYAGVDPIYEPVPVRPGAHYHMGGVDDRRRRRDRARRPLRRRRGRVRLGPRREPARRQLADGDDHVRPPRRAAPPPTRRCSRDDGEVPRAALADAERELADAARPRNERRAAVADPRRARLLDARELRRLPPRGADGRSRSRSSTACASATSAWSSRTRATSSTTT